MGNVRIWVSGGGAIALHILVLVWFPVESRLPPRVDIELLLVKNLLELPPTQPSHPPESARQPQAAPILSTPDIPQKQSEPELATVKPLNLSKPLGWSESLLIEKGSLDAVVHAFRPQFFQQLESRRDEQARRHLLETRSVAMHGTPIDAYNAIEGPTSRHIKTAKGCFNLHSNITGDLFKVGGGQRWYRVACKDLIWDPLLDPWHKERLEFDRVGRAVGR